MMKKILIVDDSRDIRDLVRVTLGSDQYEVLEAADGNQALALAAKARPDLIIMDIVMPGSIDGFEAAHLIKNNPATKATPIIFLTGTGKGATRGKKPVEAAEYFTKPFSPLQLLDKVEEILES
ncbi:MAG: response regulator [Chitinivibrionales bacterium]|nr:response regulator [Chitinivibrionales bacterium]